MNIRVRVGKSLIAGEGLFADQHIKKGTEIIQYTGEKITTEESNRRLDAGNVYIMELDDDYAIDGKRRKHTARFINHSCDPNCQTEQCDDTIWIVALRDIQAGEELTYNYGYGYEGYEDCPCTCGATTCCGYILAEKHWHLLPKRRKKVLRT